MNQEIRDILDGCLRYKPRKTRCIGLRNGKKVYVYVHSYKELKAKYPPKRHWYDLLWNVFKKNYTSEPWFSDVLNVPFRWFDRR